MAAARSDARGRGARTGGGVGRRVAAPRALEHDVWVAAARAAADAVTPEEVEEAFVASLTSRRLDLQSALGSYAVARHLPVHAFMASQSKLCAVCGLPEFLEQDLNVLNFERFEWGGVRSDHVEYVAFDLEQFQRAPRLPATLEASQLGRELLAALRAADASVTATTLAATLRMVKGNKDEREVLLDVLGVCGVLETPEHTGYRTGFVSTMFAPCHRHERALRHELTLACEDASVDLGSLREVAEERRAQWDAAGIGWEVIDGPPTDKPASWLILRGNTVGQLTVWVSGEAEMDWGTPEDGGERHYDLDSREALSACVADLEAKVGLR